MCDGHNTSPIHFKAMLGLRGPAVARAIMTMGPARPAMGQLESPLTLQNAYTPKRRIQGREPCGDHVRRPRICDYLV